MAETPDPQIHVGDVGTELRFPVTDEEGGVVPLAGYLSLTVYVYRPDKVTLTRTGQLLSDGSDGLLYYRTQAGDLAVPGLYKFQAVVTLPGGTWHTQVTSRMVKGNLGA